MPADVLTATKNSRHPLQRRFQMLASGEAASAIILPMVVIRGAGVSGEMRVPLLLSAFALGLFLMTAAIFWFRKSLGVFTSAWPEGVSDMMLVAVVLAAIAEGLTVFAVVRGTSIRPVIFSFGLQVFVFAEWINYRWIQISGGGWQKWLSGKIVTPVLARELRRERSETMR